MKKIITRAVATALLALMLIFPLTACSKKKYVCISVKDFGDIIIELDEKNAPRTVENFLKLVNEGFYNGLTFHRVMKDFMIQGGDPLGNGRGSSDERIPGEFAANGWNNQLKHARGVVSMARSEDYNSASCQFFICNADSVSVKNLDGLYAAFGVVVEGMDVVDAITSITGEYAVNGIIYSESRRAVITEIKEIKYKKGK